MNIAVKLCNIRCEEEISHLPKPLERSFCKQNKETQVKEDSIRVLSWNILSQGRKCNHKSQAGDSIFYLFSSWDPKRRICQMSSGGSRMGNKKMAFTRRACSPSARYYLPSRGNSNPLLIQLLINEYHPCFVSGGPFPPAGAGPFLPGVRRSLQSQARLSVHLPSLELRS